MTLDKAASNLQARIDGEFHIEGKDDFADMKLGREAIKRIQGYRTQHVLVQALPLPGETRY